MPSAAENADVTVVVTCFNHGELVGGAVASALRQEGGPARVVVIDDGSADPLTHAALDALPPEAEVVRQANAGVCRARNAGWQRVQTPYVVFLDADDELEPGALRLWKRALASQPDAGFAYGHRIFFGSMGGEQRFPPYDPLKLLDRHLIGLTALVRRELLEQTGGFDPRFTSYEDWELWLAALEHGWAGVRVDAVTMRYRRQAGSKFAADRAGYREFRRRLKAKHAGLYARRRELARQSQLGPAGRALYRWFWGPRPVPAAVDHALQRLLWRGEREAQDGSANSPS